MIIKIYIKWYYFLYSLWNWGIFCKCMDVYGIWWDKFCCYILYIRGSFCKSWCLSKGNI